MNKLIVNFGLLISIVAFAITAPSCQKDENVEPNNETIDKVSSTVMPNNLESTQTITMSIASNTMIRSTAPWNGFTDLHGFKGNLYCVYREGTNHTSNDGKIRVIRYNTTTFKWDGIKLLSYTPPAPYTYADLRDPKLSTRPSDGKAMLTVAATIWQGSTKIGTQSLAYFSIDMVNWGSPYILGSPGSGWLWRTEWNSGKPYNFKYGGGIKLMTGTDGTSFPTQLGSTYWGGSGYNMNETALCFTGSSMVALTRSDAGDNAAYLSTITQPPYTNISWYHTAQKIGGPDLFTMPDGQIILGARRFSAGTSGNPYVAVSRVIPNLHSISQNIAVLTPTNGSAGDCGYPGIWKYGNQIWVTYYSSQSGKACIYLAKLNYTL